MDSMKENTNLHKTSLSIIRCECGFELLLVPDLSVMSLVVEKHAQMHKENAENQREAKAVFSHIEDYLTEQILKRASQIEH